jgi:hypothetical protein
VESERAERAADFGPVEYVCKLLGVERGAAMRWFIVLVACLLDPAALMMLFRGKRACLNVQVDRRGPSSAYDQSGRCRGAVLATSSLLV